jgi:PAS domain S-box-containing protein
MVVSYQLQDSHVGAKQQLGEGVMGTVAETRAPLIVDDYRKWGGRMSNYDDIRATIGVPLIADEKLIGVFTTISSNDQKKFSQEDLELLNLFAQQAVIAIENARLYSLAQNEIVKKEKIQEEISRQKEYYEALLVNNPVAIVAADLANEIISWNPMAEKLFGYAEEEVVGKNIDEFVSHHEDLRAEATANSNQVLSGEMVHLTTKRTHKNGTLIDVELLALPVVVAGERVGFVAIYHDLTEIKKIEEELRKQNSQMLRELQLAGEIQRSFIVNDLPQIEGWGLSNVLYSAKETSGDFYDVRILPNGNIAIFIGDVVDKGVGAALFMALCWTLFRGYSGERNASPSKVFKSLNERILADTTSDQFLTAYYAILDPHSGKLTYANAGHPPSLFWSAKGQRVSRQIRTGMPIGISADVEWEDKTVTFDNGDHLLMYTDGVTEGFNNKLTDYGEKRLIDVQFAMAGSSPSEITKAVVNDLRKFAGHESQSDDIALVLLKKLKN